MIREYEKKFCECFDNFAGKKKLFKNKKKSAVIQFETKKYDSLKVYCHLPFKLLLFVLVYFLFSFSVAKKKKIINSHQFYNVVTITLKKKKKNCGGTRRTSTHSIIKRILSAVIYLQTHHTQIIQLSSCQQQSFAKLTALFNDLLF